MNSGAEAGICQVTIHYSQITIHRVSFVSSPITVHSSQVTVHRSQVTDYSLIWKLTPIFVTAFAPASLGLSVARLLMLTRNRPMCGTSTGRPSSNASRSSSPTTDNTPSTCHVGIFSSRLACRSNASPSILVPATTCVTYRSRLFPRLSCTNRSSTLYFIFDISITL